MTMYRVTYVNAQVRGEVSTFVEADIIERDAHWVSFIQTQVEETTYASGGCDNCGRTIARPLPPRTTRKIVALYPSQRVRSVELSTQAAE